MVEKVIGAVAVEVILGHGNPIDSKGDMVLLGDIRIQTAIVLGSAKFGGIDGVVVCDVGHISQAAANAGISRALPSGVVRAQRRCERRANIQPLAGNRSAIHTFGEAGSRAGGGWIEGSHYAVPGKGKKLGSDAACGRQRVECRCIVPTVALNIGEGFTNRLVAEKEENLIFPNWAAHATAELFKLILISGHFQARAVEPL